MVRNVPFFHLSPLPTGNQWWAIRGEAEDLDSMFSLELGFSLSAFRTIIWRMSPMDEGSIEPCGRVTSKTHIYKAFLSRQHANITGQKSQWWNIKFKLHRSGLKFPWRRLKAGMIKSSCKTLLVGLSRFSSWMTQSEIAYVRLPLLFKIVIVLLPLVHGWKTNKYWGSTQSWLIFISLLLGKHSAY